MPLRIPRAKKLRPIPTQNLMRGTFTGWKLYIWYGKIMVSQCFPWIFPETRSSSCQVHGVSLCPLGTVHQCALVNDMSRGLGAGQRAADVSAIGHGLGPAVWMDKENSGGYHCILADPANNLGNPLKKTWLFPWISKISWFGQLDSIFFFGKWP